MNKCKALLSLVTVVLISVLWGCAGVKERQFHPVSKNRGLEVAELVANSSDFLGSEINRLIEEHAVLIESQAEHKTPGSDNRHWLKSLFTSVAIETVMPDSNFEKVRKLSGNKDVGETDDFHDSLADFILDHQYHCTRPIYYRYFADRYGDKRELQKCNVSVPFLVATNLAEPEVVWVDPGSISAIHLLFAGEGEAMMSRFGHVMFRLIICPNKDQSSAACDSNLSQHLVLGYRAHIDEFKIDSLDGLFGGYRAYLFANRFMDVYKEYAIGEFRELYSLPLLLDEDERRDFIREISEVHWSYAGEYKFLTSNCSSLAQNFLLNNWQGFSNLDSMQTTYWRPDAFFSSLKDTELAASGKLTELEAAEREGFYFSSTQPFYELAFEMVKEAMIEPDFDTLGEYLRRNPVVRKRDVLVDKKYYQTLWNNQKLLSGQILLEELAVIRSEQRLLGEVAYFFETNNIQDIDTYLKSNLDEYDYRVFTSCVLRPIIESISPMRRNNGIPRDSAIAISDENMVRCGDQVDTTALKRVVGKIGDLNRDNWHKVEILAEYWANSINNVAYYTGIEAEISAGIVSH